MSKHTEHAAYHRQGSLVCPSCGAENTALDLRCHACGAFIRDRVPVLNLFSVLWGMIESPAATYLRIARSEQKNYVHLLFALMGPLLLSIILAAARAGDLDIPFGIMLTLIGAVGPLLGLVLLPLGAMVQRTILQRAMPRALRYRDAAAFIAYGLSPMMWASVIVLPLQLGLFGLTLFSVNPPGWQVQPLPFWMLASLDAVAVIWSVLLLPRSLMVYGTPYGRAMILYMPFWLFLILCLSGLALILPAIRF